MKRDGKEVDNPIARLLSSAVTTYKLDPDGNILDLVGYEAFIDGISRQVPTEIFEQLSPLLSIEALKAREIAEWNGRVGDYVGAEVRIGDNFVADVPYQIPGGSTINYTLHTTIAGFIPCGEKKCVRIEQAYDSQADNVAKMAGEVVSKLAQSVSPETQKSRPENSVATIKGNVKRTIDAEPCSVAARNRSVCCVWKLMFPRWELFR